MKNENKIMDDLMEKASIEISGKPLSEVRQLKGIEMWPEGKCLIAQIISKAREEYLKL
jgi:hypothetical protein